LIDLYKDCSAGLIPAQAKLTGRQTRDVAFLSPWRLFPNHGVLFPYRIGEELPTKRPLCETWARMSHADPNGPPDRRPIKVGEVWENPVTGERSVIVERPWDNPASRVTGELTALVGARVMGEHRHPALVEQFTVLEGALSIFEIWWTRWDSNPRPPHCERGALPAELLAHE
jgi:hypothetical protein